MVLKDAVVHNHIEAGGAGALGRFLIHYAQLHPDHASMAADGGFDNIERNDGTAEDVDDLEGLRNIVECGITFSPRTSDSLGLTGMMR